MISEQVLQRIVESSTDSRAVDAIGQLVSRIHELEAALRQPQAARLTEEDQSTIRVANDMFRDPLRLQYSKRYVARLLDIIDRLTAAPAQVTRDELIYAMCSAQWSKKHPNGPDWDWALTNDPDSAHFIRKAEISADAILSLLAERGLVKEG